MRLQRRLALACLKGQASCPAVILNYHRIEYQGSVPNLLSVSVEHFDAQMRVLRRDYQPLSLAQWFYGEFDKKGKKPVVVTFDDGYVDVIENGLPVLEKYQIPAILFLASQKMGQTMPFWWDQIEEQLLHQLPAQQTLKLDLPHLGTIVVNTETTSERLKSADRLSQRLKLFHPVQIQDILNFLKITNKNPSISRRTLTHAQVRTLLDHPLLSFGSHTLNHPSLGRLSKTEQKQELFEAKRQLESELQRSFPFLAYPFGGATDFNADTLQLTPNCGYQLALTTLPGLATHDRSSRYFDAYTIPRYFIGNWDEATFKRKLRSYFYFG